MESIKWEMRNSRIERKTNFGTQEKKEKEKFEEKLTVFFVLLFSSLPFKPNKF